MLGSDMALTFRLCVPFPTFTYRQSERHRPPWTKYARPLHRNQRVQGYLLVEQRLLLSSILPAHLFRVTLLVPEQEDVPTMLIFMDRLSEVL
jgi:hypothetical protein